ncbi:MAG: gliding motility-associated C-terminal domain-containing protein [Cytophagaceae bacterium]|nr:gliding motility-associated C-terminal domain-containing protein [Cytophagaceae bacterium]
MKNSMNRTRLLFLWLLVGLWPGWALASHIVGGNLEMKAQGTQAGRFTLILSLFFDEINGSPNAETATITATVFRKSDNRLMTTVTLTRQERISVKYTNEACATARSLRTTDIRYVSDLILNPAMYDDPAGYYIVWERCCRNSSADNITRPGQAGMAFYLEFPALRANGQDVLNSSPTFGTPNGEYICKGEPFKLNFDATDADGDQLKYNLVTPYSGYATSGQPQPTPRGSSSYPTVQWQDGYSAQSQIQGSPPLSINPTTGVLSVTASTLGLHVFCVEVEEFRNGVRIGSVRRDFQLLVIDCAKTSPPPPPIYTASTPPDQRKNGIRTVDFCENGLVELQTDNNSDYNYQWQRDGDNLPSATTNKLVVDQPGIYKVIVSLRSGCAKSGFSEETNVIKQPGPKTVITPDGPTNACTDRPLTLATRDGNFTYTWLRDGDTLKNEKTFSLVAQAGGLYKVIVKSKSTDCYYIPTLQVSINNLPKAELTKPGRNTICATDSLTLTATNGAGYQFEWRRDGTVLPGVSGPKLSARQTGVYTVRVTDGNKCTALSDGFKLTVNPIPVIVFDSIPTRCGNGSGLITLQATPAGGLFSGQAVTGNTFDPHKAGFGVFPITYSAVSQYQCTTEATRWAAVSQSPRVQLGFDQSIVSGDTIRLPAQGSANTTFEWTPSDGLSNSTVLSPVASPNRTTRYKLRGTYPNGCISEDEITVTVWEKVSLPNGITPNGDGVNDSWELAGMEAYPDADVRIFNRWGGEIFYSKGYSRPFDGTYQNRRLPVATYYFVIEPNNGRPTLKGSLTILE